MEIISLYLLIITSINYLYIYIPLISILTIYLIIKSSEFTFLILNNYILLDKLSFIIIILSTIRTILIIISRNIFLQISTIISTILLCLILTFISSNLFIFYIIFEIILIPTLIIITKLGNQPERLQAGIYLILYTITASLPLLIGILIIKNNFNTFFSSVTCFKINFSIIFIIAFLVKIPIFIFHL